MSLEQLSVVNSIHFWNEADSKKSRKDWIRLWHQKIEPDESVQKILKDYDRIDHMIWEIFAERVKRLNLIAMSRHQGWVQAEAHQERAQWVYYFRHTRQITLARLLPILDKATASIGKA